MSNNKWVWIGLAALVVVFLFARSRAGADVIQQPAPDNTATDQARFSFAASGLSSLTDLLLGQTQAERDRLIGLYAKQRDTALGQFALDRDLGVAQAQKEMSIARDNAYLGSALAQADAAKYAAKQAAKGSSGGNVGFGPFSFGVHW